MMTPTTKPGLMLSCLLALTLGCACGAARAHEGHHEAEPEAAAPAAPPAPRASLDTPQLELVAQREGADIVVYIDDYATNAPLDGLQVSVRSSTLTLQAAAAGEGAYRIPGDLIDAQTEQKLEISVHGAGIDAQLQAILPPLVGAAADAHAQAAARIDWRIVAAVFGALFAAGAVWLLRRRSAGRARRLGAA